MLKKIKKLLKNPIIAAEVLMHSRLMRIFPDKAFLKMAYRTYLRKKLNLDNPTTFNEKLQWLKLNDRKPEYTVYVDKYLVREHIKNTIGEQYLIPLLGVWDDPEKIDFDALPDQFVLKCNHNSGRGMCICTDKSKIDINKVKKGLKKGLKENYYLSGREWPYKNVPRRIIAEKYMVDESGYELKDYKFFCFDGEVKALFIATDRGSKTEETKFDFYDAEFNHLPFTNGHPNANKEIKKPQSFEEMKRLAEVLSKGIPQVRVDFYDINGKVYFGELTFSHWSGFVPFVPEEWDYTFGSWIDIDGLKNNKD